MIDISLQLRWQYYLLPYLCQLAPFCLHRICILYSSNTEFKRILLLKDSIEVQSSLLGKIHTKFVTILQ